MTLRYPRLVALLFPAFLIGCDSSGPAAPAEDGADGAAAEEVELHADPAIRQLQEFIAAHKAQSNPVGKIDLTRSNWKYLLPKPPLVEFTPGKTYFWELDTSKGPLKIRLFPDIAPMHVANALYLTLLGFYDGLPFHRSIQGFMVQGGCPSGNGRGDPGYKLDLELSPKVRHDRLGMLAAANSGPNTDGSQFYLTFGPALMLDGSYTIYGEVVDGKLTLRDMEKVSAPPDTDGPPLEPLTLEKARFSVE